MGRLQRTFDRRPALPIVLAMVSMGFTFIVLILVLHFQGQNDAKRQAANAAHKAAEQTIKGPICTLAETYASLPPPTGDAITRARSAKVVMAWTQIGQAAACPKGK